MGAILFLGRLRAHITALQARMRFIPTNSQIVLAYLREGPQTFAALERRTQGLLSARGLAGTLERLRQTRRVDRVTVQDTEVFQLAEVSAAAQLQAQGVRSTGRVQPGRHFHRP